MSLNLCVRAYMRIDRTYREFGQPGLRRTGSILSKLWSEFDQSGDMEHLVQL